jgi:hypothetical protein
LFNYLIWFLISSRKSSELPIIAPKIMNRALRLRLRKLRRGVPKDWENEDDDDTEDETVEWGFDDVGNVFPCFGHGERFAHTPFFDGTAVLELALFDKRVAC